MAKRTSVASKSPKSRPKTVPKSVSSRRRAVPLRATRLELSAGTELPTIAYARRCEQFRRRPGIHRRKVVPDLPMGELIGDAIPTARLELDIGGRAAAMAAAAPLALDRNVQIADVATADTASHVCEPSAAINGNVVFATGNWFACVSTDGGQTFRYVNPFTAFPDPAGSKFCCDQVVLYSDRFDLFFWLLQYTANPAGENIQRVAYASTQDVVAGKWRHFDISSKSLGLAGAWLDFPDLAVGTGKLYVSTNAFKGEAWAGNAVVRVDLARLKAGQVSAQKIVAKDVFNFRLAQNCADTIYWGTHVSTSRMRVYAWNEAKPSPTTFEVNVPSWSRQQPYQSLTPDGRNWLERVDGRVVAATRAGHELWFAWTAAAGGVNARPHPYVQVEVIDVDTKQLKRTLNLWDADHAVACPAFGTNAQDEVGVSYTIGGGISFPTHVVGVLTGTASHAIAFNGQRGPTDQKWGDYLAVRRCYPAQNRFIATGYTLQPGAGNSDATPNLTIFGR